MKRFTPLFYLILLSTIYVLLPSVIITILWVVVGTSIISIMGSIFCGGLIVLYPIVLYQNRENASVVISQNAIENYINDRTSNFGWIEDIINIRSIAITDNIECQKYFKNCKSKRVILIDFGNENVKYIALTWFTNRQAKNMVQTINERREALKNVKTIN